MGVSHSMNYDQVDSVLTEFEATTTSMRGIEEKMGRVNGYITEIKTQREDISRQADSASKIIDDLSESLNEKCASFLTYFTSTLETFACLVDDLEFSILDLGLQDAPRRMQREFGPLLVPAVVLCAIITASNCYLGFLLAGDETLSSANQLEPDDTASGINVLNLFAIFHAVLVGVAAAYLLLEGARKLTLDRRRTSAEGELTRREPSALPCADDRLQWNSSAASVGSGALGEPRASFRRRRISNRDQVRFAGDGLEEAQPPADFSGPGSLESSPPASRVPSSAAVMPSAGLSGDNTPANGGEVVDGFGSGGSSRPLSNNTGDDDEGSYQFHGENDDSFPVPTESGSLDFARDHAKLKVERQPSKTRQQNWVSQRSFDQIRARHASPVVGLLRRLHTASDTARRTLGHSRNSEGSEGNVSIPSSMPSSPAKSSMKDMQSPRPDLAAAAERVSL